MNFLKNQAPNSQTRHEFLSIKRKKPNRDRINGRMTYDIKPDILIAKNPELFIESLSYKEKQLFNLMLNMKSHYYDLKPTHNWLAEQLDCSRTHIQNMINRFEACGILSSQYRHHKACHYRFSNWLRLPDVVERLQKYLPGLKCFALAVFHLSMLISTPKDDLDIKFSQLIKDQDLDLKINRESLKKGYEDFYGECRKQYKVRRKNYEDLQAAKRKTKFVKNQEKSHQGGSCKPEDKAATYGGTGLYDRKTSQNEIELRNNIHERQKRKYAMEFDNEAQPRYNEPTLPRRQCAANASSMRCEDPVAASERLVSWTQSEQYKKFAALFGEEMAFKMCNKIVSQAIEGTKE